MKNDKLNILSSICGISISLFLTYAMMMLAPAAYAQVAKPSIDFNHMKTGFPLTGAHARVECETCHVGGLFKGTPKDCAGCHSVGRRVLAQAKSVSHMPTTDTCDTCHTNTVSFIGARFNHLGVQPKACATCHNGLTAPAKKVGHVATILSCDSCHRTSSWIPAGFDHAPPLATCITCHYMGGPGKAQDPSTHIPTLGQACDSCHTNFITFLGAFYDHAGQTQCATCHITGQYGAKTKPSNHIPTASVTCDTCHVGTGFISFAGSTMNHNAVLTTTCSTCHNGSYLSQKGSLGLGAQSKQDKPNHVVTTAECGSCHLGRSSFAGGYLDHLNPPVNVTIVNNCNSCHDGVHALGKTNSATHNGTTAQCSTCHGNANNYTSFAGAAFAHNPATVTGVCGTCHLGQSAAVTKGSTHIPTSGNDCAACHATPANSTPITITFTAPLPTMRHSAVTSIACATCHNGGYLSEKGTLGVGALAQPIGHVVTNGAACNSCHLSASDTNPLGWQNAGFSHTGVTPATCGTCHIPGTSGAKTMASRTTHIPVSGNACDACHVSGYTTFAGAKMYHPAVTSVSCFTCHNGSYLTEKGTLGLGARAMTTISNHIPVSTTVCSICHTGTAYTSFVSPLASSTIMHNSGINISSCKACHAPSPSYLGVTGSKVTVGSHQGSKSSDDCSQSGCHKPLGKTGTAFISFN